ncbi:MAG: hypothetical protein DRJ38_03570 [Thermoprotei archaeon]|nr:MAG: hypothetical protein DRJ38_03570 [Thermoprotei archaeon]
MKINEWINRIFAGCGRESEKLELQSILAQIAEEYHSGNMSDEELQQYAEKLCQAIIVYANRCGKDYRLDQCLDDFVTNVRLSVPRGVLLASITETRQRKRRSRRSSSGFSVI